MQIDKKIKIKKVDGKRREGKREEERWEKVEKLESCEGDEMVTELSWKRTVRLCHFGRPWGKCS